MINTWFKFEDKIQNTSILIRFTRNHRDDDTDDDRTKSNMSPPGLLGDIISKDYRPFNLVNGVISNFKVIWVPFTLFLRDSLSC